MEELLKHAEADRESLTEKLHEMNKARHDCENGEQAEVERNRQISEVVLMKDELLDKRQQDIDDIEKKLNEKMNEVVSIEAKMTGLEKQVELTKTSLTEKISNLQEVNRNEHSIRETWI